MGGFKKSCSNVCHSTWFQKSENVNVKVPAYRYLQAFKKMATEAGLKPHKVHFVCDKCIEIAELKKELTRFLSTPNKENDSVAEVHKFHSLSNSFFSHFDLHLNCCGCGMIYSVTLKVLMSNFCHPICSYL